MADKVGSEMCSCPCAGDETLSCGCFDYTLISEILNVRSQCEVNDIQCTGDDVCELNADLIPTCVSPTPSKCYLENHQTQPL